MSAKTASRALVAPSILSADFAKLGEEVAKVEAAGADWIHVDVMDGHFVPNLTIGPPVVEALRKVTKLPLDVHLMISNPDQYLDAFVAAGATSLTVHQEATPNLKQTLGAIRKHGVKAGVSVSPETSVETIREVLPLVDLVLVMTVHPGFGGQKFIPECLEKVRTLAKSRDGLSFLIEADGGINESTARDLRQAGCDVFVAGSAIFKTSNYADAIRKIRGNSSGT